MVTALVSDFRYFTSLGAKRLKRVSTMKNIAAEHAASRRDMPTPQGALRGQSERRNGVLLLIVLSMLTLFLMLGAAYLVVSTRSRETARAFARLAMQSENIRVQPDRLLDAAFLTIVRGGTSPFILAKPEPPLTLPAAVDFESILADKYGTSVTATASTVTTINGLPLLSVRGLVMSNTTSIAHAIELQGRTITLLGAGRKPTSHRIMKAEITGTAGTTATADLTIDNLSSRIPFQLPGNNVPVVINGRDFDGHANNEPWDGFDDNNVFLSHVAPLDIFHTGSNSVSGTATASPSVSSSEIRKVGFVRSGTTPAVIEMLGGGPPGFPFGADNDNDGVKDGFFFDIGLPSITLANGETLRLDVSALVVDLDSRFNVNAHGSLAPMTYPQSHSGWADSTALPGRSTMPLGSGYGPAEINASFMFPLSLSGTPPYSASRWGNGAYDPYLYIFSGISSNSQTKVVRPSTSRFGGSTARALVNAEGRYGETPAIAANSTAMANAEFDNADNPYPLARPGKALEDDELSQFNDRAITPDANNAIAVNLNAGVPPQWWNGQNNYNWTTGVGNIPTPRGVFNSPPDLHGRMITTTGTPSGILPRLIFAKPEWGDGETKDDPYELRLDARAPRSGVLSSAATTSDNLFNASELEAILRPYDIDSAHLPSRLRVALGSAAEEARLKVTTETWDTTMVTGTAAHKIREWAKTVSGTLSGTSAITGVLGGELARGERLNINRPLTSDKPDVYSATHSYYKQRQALFKDLYTLLVALGQPASIETAQWAANVVDFRDADSTMTPFEFDTNPRDGWDVNNDASNETQEEKEKGQRGLVWGAERPELFIAETSAWEDDNTGELFVMLHRPWNCAAYGAQTNTTPGEPLDKDLDYLLNGDPTNQLDLGKKSDGKLFSDTGTYPIWRLRIKDDASGAVCYARFDINTSGTASEHASSSVTSDETTPKLDIDSWLCVMGNNSLSATIPPAIPKLTMSGTFRVPGTLPTTTGPDRTATVYLERLTDPTAAVSTSVWNTGSNSVPMYAVVDQATVKVVNRTQVAGAVPPGKEPVVSTRKKATVWKSDFSTTASSYSLSPDHLRGGQPVWFPWNNRPYISSAELLLVPGNDSVNMLLSYAKPSSSSNGLSGMAGGSPPISQTIFDALTVPTRYAAIHTTLNSTRAAILETATGIFPETTPVAQLSSYREPGRVNLNTVTSEDVWNAVVAGPLTVTGTAASAGDPQPIKTRKDAGLTTSPAKNMAELLALSGSIATSLATTVSDVELEDKNGNGVLDYGEDTNGNGVLDFIRLPKSLNPAHELYTATRLANTATIRSNVYGIWITLRESVADDPDSIKLHRAFYIFDRSIPVGFEPGKDHNVWDAVLLRRIIE